MNEIWSIGKKRRWKLVRAEVKQRRNLRSTQELLVDIREQKGKGNAARVMKQTKTKQTIIYLISFVTVSLKMKKKKRLEAACYIDVFVQRRRDSH